MHILKEFVYGFILQLQFLTRLPVPLRIQFEERTFARGVIFAPVIGFIIGVAIAGVYLLAALLDKRALAVLLALVGEIVLTGGLHLDGFADMCDGLFSYRDRERMMAIMKDSRIGTNGALGLILLILLKFIMLLSVPESRLVACLLVMPVLGRMTIAWSVGISPYARKDEPGIAGSLTKNTGFIEIIAATVISLGFAVPFLKLAAVPLAMVVIATALLVNLFAVRKIGGITGDVLGGVIEISEAVFIAAVLLLGALYGRFQAPFIS